MVSNSFLSLICLLLVWNKFGFALKTSTPQIRSRFWHPSLTRILNPQIKQSLQLPRFGKTLLTRHYIRQQSFNPRRLHLGIRRKTVLNPGFSSVLSVPIKTRLTLRKISYPIHFKKERINRSTIPTRSLIKRKCIHQKHKLQLRVLNEIALDHLKKFARKIFTKEKDQYHHECIAGMCARQDYQIEVKFSVAPPSGCKTMRLNNCSGLISETNLQNTNLTCIVSGFITRRNQNVARYSFKCDKKNLGLVDISRNKEQSRFISGKILSSPQSTTNQNRLRNVMHEKNKSFVRKLCKFTSANRL